MATLRITKKQKKLFNIFSASIDLGKLLISAILLPIKIPISIFNLINAIHK